MASRIITYCPSATLPLTRSCVNRCLYCGYRKDNDGIISFRAIRKIVEKAHQEGILEILVLSGERADEVSCVREDLDRLGMDSFVSWAVSVCEYLLTESLLPHVNIGTLDITSLKRLRNVSASMGLMIEGVNPRVNALIHPGKDLQKRFETLESAGRLKIPFTTGMLMGTGENQQDRIDCIRAIERIHNKYGHIQEIILQKYIPNHRSQLPPKRVSLSEMKELVCFSKYRLPEVSIQIPPNIDQNWTKLVAFGVDDLGGIGNGVDVINPGNPWPDINTLEQDAVEAGAILKKRLSIYHRFYRLGWYAERIENVLTGLIEGKDEYAYYSQRGGSRQRSLSG